MRFAAEVLRQSQGSWTSMARASFRRRMTKSKPSLRGAVGRLISIDPWGNGTCILIAKGTDVQDPELVSGLQPKTVAVDCLCLSKPRIVPDGWTRDAVNTLADRWQTIQTAEGKDLWLRMDTGQTHYSSPFLAEAKSAATDDEHTRVAYWGEVTEPSNAVVRPEAKTA